MLVFRAALRRFAVTSHHSVAPPVLVTMERENVAFFEKWIADHWEVRSDYSQDQAEVNKNPPRVFHLDDYEKVKDTLWGYDSERPPFDIPKFMHRLTTHRHGHSVLYSPVVSSTQTMLNKRFRGIDQGLLCVTQVQTNGSGRGSNSWKSPYGCLMFSYKSTLYSAKYLAMIQYLVSLCIVNTIGQIPFCKGLDIRIKWPNDIYANGQKKICGILCQSELYDNAYNITTGIGLNISNSTPSTCIQDLVNEKYLNNPPIISRELILANFLNQYAIMFRIFREKGFEYFIPEYTKKWLHHDQWVKILDGKKETEVQIQGLSENGYLLAVDHSGIKHELLPDGNHFDFFHGLISKKM